MIVLSVDLYETESAGNGIGTGRSSVRVTIGRGDLGAKYQCRVTNDALTTPLVSWVELDVNGKVHLLISVYILYCFNF